MTQGMNTPELPPAALAAIERGNSIEAIKIVRESLHVGLAEAKRLVDDASTRLPKRASDRAGIAHGTTTTLPPAALDALRRGSKIEAVKIVREELRLGLKEAKDLVDAVPPMHASASAAPLMRGDSRRGGTLGLVAIVILVALAMYYVMR